MFIKQLYTKCLAECAYYIESKGESVIIDPLRDIDVYLELARERNTTIKYIFETHFHADFVSGHLDLARETGAEIVFGPTSTADFDFYQAKDREEFILGGLVIRALHTPGHSLESTCYLLLDDNHRPHAVFTGDTLFVGDVGRPDISANTELNTSDLAGLLYDSLHKKIMSLPDSVIVFPGHGAGSLCGKNLSDETASTIGTQRRNNYALLQPDKESFVDAVLENLLPPPKYFYKNVRINRSRYEKLDLVLSKELNPLSVDQFNNEMQNGAFIIDTRSNKLFCEEYIPGTINIGHDGFFAVWVGTLVEDLNTPIVLITDEGKEEETIIRLARVGYENVRGYLLGGVEIWKQKGGSVDSLPSVCAPKFKLRNDSYPVIDVRNSVEFDDSLMDNITNIPLAEIEQRVNELGKETSYLLCKSGYLSTVAGSILQKMGYSNFINVTGGVDALEENS